MVTRYWPRLRGHWVFLAIWIGCTSDTQAEWLARTGVNAYYTDDVTLFSVTRRLSLKDDPTQPMVDRPRQGGDFVYEPNGELEWSTHNAWGETSLSLDAGAYVFTNRTAFTHSLYEFQFSQSFESGTKFSVLYLVPDLFLGQNEFMGIIGTRSEHDEKLTNHYWSMHLDQVLTDQLTVRLLGRYGLRNYEKPFQHRDTRFFTVGPHLEWAITPDVEVLLGYHYEHGVASQWKASHFPDDVSYINHYASSELKWRVMQRLTAILIFDFEKNDFTTHDKLVDHYLAVETVYQGEIELLYALSDSTLVKLGWQHGSRTLTTEPESIKNNNVWIGLDYIF